MAAKSMKVWLDPEGDFLEVIFDPSKPGYYRETVDDRIMERVDEGGNVIGFSIMHLHSIASPTPLDVGLT